MSDRVFLDPQRLASIRAALRAERSGDPSRGKSAPTLPDLGVIFFSGLTSDADPYALLLSAARLIDSLGFTAIWTPERHFTEAGGAYPNPAVLGAALAMVTDNVRIRAGSVNLPLHDVLRVAEEWALVDNLSHGRVDLAVASGWHARDFVLAPEEFHNRAEVAASRRAELAALWRGESCDRLDPNGEAQAIVTYPRPVQPDLSMWLTTSQRVESWEAAGREGCNVLSALINFGPAELKERISVYREARRTVGLDPTEGVVSLMLHTYVGESNDDAVRQVRPAMTEYLSSFVSQHSTAGQRREDAKEQTLANLGDDRDDFLEMVFQRYVRSSSLIGDREAVRDRLSYFKSIGVDEVACLVDFGLPNEDVLASLRQLSVVTGGGAQ